MTTGSLVALVAVGAWGLATGPVAAAPVDSDQDIANTTYECALAMRYAEEEGKPLRFSSRVLFDEFAEMERTKGVSADVATAYTKSEFETLTKTMNPAGKANYILAVAQQCEELTIEREARRITAERKAADEQGGEINVAFLRDHFAKNRNPRVIVDYIVDRYPGGKGWTGPEIPEGEYLAQLLLEIGEPGVKALSDGALAAIISQPYWQYNPPATRLADGEYRRRMRVKKFSEREGKAWAQRVQQERRLEMRQAANSMAERWGANVRCTNVAPNGVEGRSYTSCKVLDRYGQ